jgi:hypothetical protein
MLMTASLQPQRIRQKGEILEVLANGDAVCLITVGGQFQVKTLISADHFYSVTPEPLLEFWWYPEEEHLTLREVEDDPDLRSEIAQLETETDPLNRFE